MSDRKDYRHPDDRYLLHGIGAMFKEVRAEQGLNQREASKRAGMTQARISYLERGTQDIRILTLQHWARSYGYELEVNLVPLPEEAETA